MSAWYFGPACTMVLKLFCREGRREDRGPSAPWLLTSRQHRKTLAPLQPMGLERGFVGPRAPGVLGGVCPGPGRSKDQSRQSQRRRACG